MEDYKKDSITSFFSFKTQNGKLVSNPFSRSTYIRLYNYIHIALLKIKSHASLNTLLAIGTVPECML